MPYYGDWYAADMPQSNHPQFYQQAQRQNVPFQSPLQVVVPPRQPQPQQLPSPQVSIPPVHYQVPYQQQPQYQQYSTTIPIQSHPQYSQPQPQRQPQPLYVQQNQQAFTYDQQVHQRYQPPPPPRVIVPPSPSQQQRVKQEPIPQQSPYPVTAASLPSTMPQKQSIPQERALKVTKPNAPRLHNTSKPQSTNDSAVPANQYPSLLLTLADEYLEASRKLEHRTDDYYKLISTSLGCMEAALKNFKLSPLREAQLSLKYAQVLHDETNNHDEAETILTKAIDLCERMKFIDLKYAMQLLLAKVLFRSKPRAALRDLQGMIQDIETYRHVAWEYAFRFQAVFFCTDGSEHDNLYEAIHQLEKVQHVAKLNKDYAIYAYVAIIESLLHLHSTSEDAVSNSQQAMAKARSLQLNPDVEQHCQMPTLMEMVDLMWSMRTFNDKEIEKKRQNLKDTLYSKSLDKPWTNDEFTWIRVSTTSLKGIPTQEGGLIQEVDNKHFITLAWMNKKELEAIGFLLMGASVTQHNHAQNHKAERFFNEGYLHLREDITDDPHMLSGKDEQMKHRAHLVAMHYKIEVAFICCSSGRWAQAQEILKVVRSHLVQVKDAPAEMASLVQFLAGCIQQGIGDMKEALDYYQSPELILHVKQTAQSPSSRAHTQHVNPIVDSLRVLAALNTALIIRESSHPQHQHLRSLVDIIGAHITSSSPTLISASYSLLLATLPNTTMLQMKQLLYSSLDGAKRVVNNQIISLTLTLMQDKFFRGGVQDGQAVKCAKAAAHQVKTKWGNPLWIAVSGALEVESLLLVMQQTGDLSRQEEVTRKKDDIVKAWAGVPETVKRVMGDA